MAKRVQVSFPTSRGRVTFLGRKREKKRIAKTANGLLDKYAISCEYDSWKDMDKAVKNSFIKCERQIWRVGRLELIRMANIAEKEIKELLGGKK